jgi:hypothetical protein
VERDFLRLGQFPAAGRSLEVTSRYLELDGRPWLPVMGEFHYSRYPRAEWEIELRKMRAGGIDIVASYVFWNHHEAAEGQFDWSAQRDLRHFVSLAQRVGLYFYLRPGPWVHAESRNGGFPDWLLTTGELRCNDEAYLRRVTRFFGEIGAQLRDQMWCDGGPVIGLQLENEYDRVGPGAGAEHIAELKRIAIDAGLTVPLYTVTGWPTLDIPPREVVPVSGAYPDGFWSGETGPLPPSGVFQFNTSRAIGEMGNVGGTPATEQIDKRHYPFFLAEAGGGMHVSYHRRPVVSADDVAATCLVQIGSGATLYGYYMFHGGTNPGRGLHETQESGYPNDVPVLGYDFRAPLGQYGQRRVSYDRLRALHLFLAAFGSELAAMEAVLPDGAATEASDRSQLRVAARGAGNGGFLFVNNHVRHHPMPDFADVHLRVQTEIGAIDLPATTVHSGAHFIWPIGQRIGAAVLRYATVQPLTRIVESGHQTWVAFSHPTIAVELCFEPSSMGAFDVPAAWLSRSPQGLVLRPPATRAPQWLHFVDVQGQRHSLLLLTRALADQCYRPTLCGRDRLVLCAHGVHVERGDTLVVSAPHDELTTVRLFPADDLQHDGLIDGFAELTLKGAPRVLPEVEFDVLHDQQYLPAVRMGPPVSWRKGPVPLAPDDAEFRSATHIHLQLDERWRSEEGRVLLDIDYVGDAARLYADGELVDDNFNDGEAWIVGIDRYARDGHWPRFELRIVAARPDLPIFLEAAARYRVATATGRAYLRGVRATLWRSSHLRLHKHTVCAANHE